MMDLQQSAIMFIVITILNTWLMAFAYKNVKFVLKHKYVYLFVFFSFLNCTYFKMVVQSC